MGFDKEPISIQGYFEHVRQASVANSFYASAEHYMIGLYFNWLRKIRAFDRDKQAVAFRHFWRDIAIIADEDDAGFTRLGIIFFAESVCFYIPVKDIHIS